MPLSTADHGVESFREALGPEGVPQQDCHLSHTRPVWRLENHRAVLVAYQIYRGPKNQYGKIPGIEKLAEFAKMRNPGRRLTTPQDVASAIAALMDDRTQWMTGNVIRVDGGEDIVT